MQAEITEASNLISVFAMNHPQNRFDENGVILQPTMCEITEVLNGEYSLVLNHPIDSFGRWKYLQHFRIIKALGQLFRIYRVQTTMASDGSMQRTAYARHIFYDLNDKSIMRAEIGYAYAQGETSAHNFITTIMSSWHDDWGSYPFYTFSWNSDINKSMEEGFKTVIENISPAAAILNASNSVINRFGGELHRNNFDFSLYEHKEGSRRNAFNIKYGVDMIDVQEDIDYGTYVSNVVAKDNYGRTASIHWPESHIRPHDFTKTIVFKYNSAEESNNNLMDDMTAYFNKYCTPNIAYKVNYVNYDRIKGMKDFAELQRRNVGDDGIIKNEIIGIETHQKVVKKVTDAIRNETKSIQLSNLSRSFVRDNEFNISN